MSHQSCPHDQRPDASAAQGTARDHGRLTDSELSEKVIARLIVISGPSGAGKGTLIKGAMKRVEGLTLSVSATTRPIRGGEEDGRDYYFLSADQFKDWVAKGRFLEWAEYAGHMYGTPAAPVQDRLESGEDVILEIELKGAGQVLIQRPEALMIYIMPPSAEELERRLRGRRTDSEEAIAKRMARAREEIATVEDRLRDGLPPTHYVIVNDSVNRASTELATIIETTRKQDEQTHSR